MPNSDGRAILHVDMDAFYASVEEFDDPTLAGQAVIVGGLGNRGVVSTANYEARRFGVHSAMPMARARRLCPGARFLRPRPARYREVSASVFSVFREFTPLFEGLSLDEAFLDIGQSIRLFGPPDVIAEEIRRRIRSRTGLTASVGVAHNKFLAKLASDVRKPDGMFVVEPGRVREFLDPMPVERLWGIGKCTAPKLRQIGVLTVGQLRRSEPALLQQALGNRVQHFLRLARGEDDRPVQPDRPDKSISNEQTFEVSLTSRDALLAELLGQAENVAGRLRTRQLLARTLTVKIRDDRFRTVTRSKSMVAPSNSTLTLYRLARALLMRWRGEHSATPVRLLGIGVTGLEGDEGAGHLAGDSADDNAARRVDRVFDSINRRYAGGVVHGKTLKREK
ncbi:MAG: DNA polymerase IV [Xanthomonadales bacterium]|nr:DNA polymerase IV [Gammaproteobacteria bacterium]MBT8052160.1 DNA polymerase IV [Gammaproteobacteria bacterium]MBT8056845.1 DNA polymerase IV [Gammaproteobacteria bacterium]NNJ79495.1 DNA polymerase IV [Xanthomonadales bacterium]NNL05633.1 DNA polymerase IV [Xanthomonadales bacterium]